MNTVIDQTVEFIRRHEGFVPHFYLDPEGNVTIGVGLLLPCEDDALALPIQLFAGGAAGLNDIRTDWRAVKQSPAGYQACWYKRFCTTFLPAQDAETVLRSHLGQNRAVLRSHIAGFDALPGPAQVALLDMAYNVGTAGLLARWPRMLRSIQIGDWTSAAGDSHRIGVSEIRNAEAAQLLLSAAA